MNMHKDARLTPFGRDLLVERVIHQGMRAEEAAKASILDGVTHTKRPPGFPGRFTYSSLPPFSKENFWPRTDASYIRPPFAIVKIATPS